MNWPLISALGLCQIVSWGSLYYAIALLLEPLSLALGVHKETVVGAYSLALLIAGICSSPIGALIDRIGGRWVMTGGSVLAGLMLILLSRVQNVGQLYAIWACLGVAMAATLYDPIFAVLGQVYKGNQRKAITIVTLFGGLASSVFWPLTQYLVAKYGWQQALLILASFHLLGCASVHAFMLPSGAKRLAINQKFAALYPNPSVGSSKNLHQVLKDPSFYGLCLAFTISALVFSAMSLYLLPVLQSKGLSAATAAWVGALVGAMQVLGRIAEYVFLAKVRPTHLGAGAMFLLPVALVILITTSDSITTLALFALIYGVGNGVLTIVRGAIPEELYGQENYGAVNGAMGTPVLIAKAAGPITAALLLAQSGDLVNLVTWLAGLALMAAVVFTITVYRYSRK